VITGVHAVLFTRDADELRRVLADALGFPSVDAGGGWSIFALPPAELAAHPSEEGGRHELYLMCDDLDRTVAELRERGLRTTRPPTDEGWGVLTELELPGDVRVGLYQPRHATPRPLA
jgi:hypothetical protein